jgi:cyclopropane fatty-acyl-phospholipid synthase-like methyltransferase
VNSKTGKTALEAHAAERNKDAILAVLGRVLPAEGRILEIASGTGQHAVHFARSLCSLQWQPSDPDPAMIESIEARRVRSGLANIAAPLKLDVLDAEWPAGQADAIVCINMIHIAPWAATAALFSGAAALLGRGAPLVLYGPFRRDGQHTAVSNAAFDESLKARQSDWGVRDLEQEVVPAAERAGFVPVEVASMPANNCCVVFALA